MVKKLVVFGIFVIIVCFWFFQRGLEDKLKDKGYLDDEVKIICNKLSHYDYFLGLDYDKSLIDILSSKDFLEENFETYVEYYMENKDENISDIITIVNSGYDLMDYPASSLLADLVLEKYYIQENVARYLDYGNTNKLSSDKIISLVNSNADLGFYNVRYESDTSLNNVVLVNKFYGLSEGYEPDDLVSLSSDYNKGYNFKMREEAALALMKMIDAAKLDNIILYNMSAYRSYDYQVNLYNRYIQRGDNADVYSARPGHSEHQTGLCTDLNDISSNFEGTDEDIWLQKNAYKYGFILRFPKGKEDITGYKYEPWHYRYVGDDVALIIYEDDITLEEYYAYYIENTSV